ncbi:superoxide dismutase [Ni] [Adhaeretor mobilis]|uniref:Nickel-containing superoxide dismutase n=1 Tax=Adhaeretor mobilis TaxID=1930276 RepID=A0A517MPF5_9BACT|nr:superoxide dismutase [Ni] [Adhaeretor mobilis]QDS96768.1 Nickel-containing superoxide dismutase [Adhaeretor mobilis]
MKRRLLAFAMIALAAGPLAYVYAHCEVPCGIYDDDGRFTDMREDQTTIAKAITNIVDMAGTHDATGHNQLARWVTTKEDHATRTQHTIAQYFMTQRIKADDPKYVEKLTAAHGVMVAAMKCKQAADPATAEELSKAIAKFETAYSGHAHGAHGDHADHSHK